MDMMIKFLKDNELFFAWIAFYMFIGIGLFLCGGIIYYWVLEVIEKVRIGERKGLWKQTK